MYISLSSSSVVISNIIPLATLARTVRNFIPPSPYSEETKIINHSKISEDRLSVKCEGGGGGRGQRGLASHQLIYFSITATNLQLDLF